MVEYLKPYQEPRPVAEEPDLGQIVVVFRYKRQDLVYAACWYQVRHQTFPVNMVQLYAATRDYLYMFGRSEENRLDFEMNYHSLIPQAASLVDRLYLGERNEQETR